MAMEFNTISEICPEKEASITIMAKVIRLWLESDFSKQRKPFSLEMVLMDNKGDRIHASIRKTLIYKFQRDLREGSVYSFQTFGVAVNGGSYRTCRHSYKISFQFATRVVLMDNVAVPGSVYDIVPISEITGGGFDTDYLVDVMGLLTGVGTERELDRNGNNTKINVISIEADGHRIECTLFGPYVDELNTFLASGEVQNAVVLVQFGKVKCFQDKINLQNCMNCTKLIFNPNYEEAVKLRKRMTESMESPSQPLSQLTDASKVGIAEDFLEMTPRKTIKGLKECKKESSYVVFATVKRILDDEDWWYTTCICTKAVYPDCKMFFCEKCNKHVMKIHPRYRIKVCVEDETGSATFVIFDRDATILFNKSCADMFETHEKRSGHGGFPNEINDLVNKSFLFKVEFKDEFNFKFEQSFTVKKICSDVSIMSKFKDRVMKSVDVNVNVNVDVNVNSDSSYLVGRKEKMIEDFSPPVRQDLMPKFSSEAVENESQTDEIEGIDLSKDSEELTLKVDCASEQSQSDLQLPLKMLKKKIKIEKN